MNSGQNGGGSGAGSGSARGDLQSVTAGSVGSDSGAGAGGGGLGLGGAGLDIALDSSQHGVGGEGTSDRHPYLQHRLEAQSQCALSLKANL